MKVLIIHNRYQTNIIGGEDIVYENELKNLRKQLGSENVFAYEVSNDKLNKLKLIFSIWFSFTHYHNIKKIVKKNKIDLVHIHNFYPLLTPSVFKAAKDSGAKVVHTLHSYRLWCVSGIFFRENYGICELCTKNKFSLKGIINKCYRGFLSQSVLAQLTFWFYEYTKIFNHIDYFFVLTNFQKQKVLSLGIDEKRIILKPNGLDISCHAAKHKSGYIYVGRLDVSKGIFELLEVWNKLDEKYLLTIIGTGKEDIKEQLEVQYHKKNIIFKGKCSREKMFKTIAQAKYLVQPSLCYETFGLTMIEAMSVGVPVIGFSIGTRKDFIQDGVNGFIASKDNLKAVIEKSFMFVDYESLSKNAIIKSKAYASDNITQKQIEIYKNILQER